MKELFTLFKAFFQIGICTFGGGYAMLPMLEREVVKRYKWASMEELLDYFAISQCTPGVIAVNTATFIGYKRRGIAGGIVATLGVVAPSIVIIAAIAALLSGYMENEIVLHAFVGIRIAVCALILDTIIKLAKSACKVWWQTVLAVCAFVVAALLSVSTIYIIVATIGGAIVGHLIAKSKGDGAK